MSPLQFTADVCAHVPESQIKLPIEALDNFKHLPYALLPVVIYVMKLSPQYTV